MRIRIRGSASGMMDPDPGPVLDPVLDPDPDPTQFSYCNASLTVFVNSLKLFYVLGYLCEMFFNKKRDEMVEGIRTMRVWRGGKYNEWTDQELTDIEISIRNVAIIGRVASTSKVVNVIKFRDFCIQVKIYKNKSYFMNF